MQLIACIILILLMVLQANCSCYAGSRENDAQCGTYCYQVVKPLLQFADAVKTHTNQFSELEDKIKEQATIIVSLNKTINHKDLYLNLQINLSDSFKSLNQNLNNKIRQYETQISNLQYELKSKDITINNLQDEFKSKEIQRSGNIKEMEDKIKAYQQTSSCFGRLTELHTIEVHRSKPETFAVPCDSNLAGSGWTVIQRRMDGSVNFNRNWSEYKEGFGNLRGEFFIGLEKLHMLTQSQPHELYIYLMDFANETRYARYSNFAIGSEETSYELQIIGGYSGNAEDSLNSHKNLKFSTLDKDNDTYKDNCAKIYGSGWWFLDCYYSNLNGVYIYNDSGKEVTGITWNGWKKRPMKFVQMMIKPKTL